MFSRASWQSQTLVNGGPHVGSPEVEIGNVGRAQLKTVGYVVIAIGPYSVSPESVTCRTRTGEIESQRIWEIGRRTRCYAPPVFGGTGATKPRPKNAIRVIRKPKENRPIVGY